MKELEGRAAAAASRHHEQHQVSAAGGKLDSSHPDPDQWSDRSGLDHLRPTEHHWEESHPDCEEDGPNSKKLISVLWPGVSVCVYLFLQ